MEIYPHFILNVGNIYFFDKYPIKTETVYTNPHFQRKRNHQNLFYML